MEMLIWTGAAISLAGIAGLIFCILRAVQAKRAGLPDAEMKARLAANSEIMQLRKSVQLAAQKILDCVNPNRI